MNKKELIQEYRDLRELGCTEQTNRKMKEISKLIDTTLIKEWNKLLGGN